MPDNFSNARHALICHPCTPCPEMRALMVDVRFDAFGALHLVYQLYGEMCRILWPSPQMPGFMDGLWQHSCCELFMAAVDRPEYREFNFSPSGQWAVYNFVDYRQRDLLFKCAHAVPQIHFHATPGECLLSVQLPSELLPFGEQFELALSVVIEMVDGKKSYWALRHAAAQPDFHLRQSFVLPMKVNT